MSKNKKRVKISKNPDGSVMQFSREPNVPLNVKGFQDDAQADECRDLGKQLMAMIAAGDPRLADIPGHDVGKIRASLRRTFPGETWMDKTED